MSRSNRNKASARKSSTDTQADTQATNPIPPHLIKTLPGICGASMTPGERYAMRSDKGDPDDVVLTSTQLMQNHVPEDATIIQAITDRTYVISSMEARPADNPLAMRGLAAPFRKRAIGNTNIMRPARNHDRNHTVPSVGDSEFEEPEVGTGGTGDTLKVQTEEKTEQDKDPNDDSHLLDSIELN